MAALVLLSVLTGVLTTFVFQRTANAPAIRTALRRIYAHLLEFRLFFDQPRLIWNAQVGLMQENVRLLRLVLLPTLILALPMTYLFWQLGTIYGHRPLRSGEPAVISAIVTAPVTGSFELQTTGGLAIETPPIRVSHENQIVWRVRQTGDAPGSLSLTVNGRPASARIEYPKTSSTWIFLFVAISTAAALVASSQKKRPRYTL